MPKPSPARVSCPRPHHLDLALEQELQEIHEIALGDGEAGDVENDGSRCEIALRAAGELVEFGRPVERSEAPARGRSRETNSRLRRIACSADVLGALDRGLGCFPRRGGGICCALLAAVLEAAVLSRLALWDSD